MHGEGLPSAGGRKGLALQRLDQREQLELTAAHPILALESEDQAERVGAQRILAAGIAADLLEPRVEAVAGGVLVEIPELQQVHHPERRQRLPGVEGHLVGERHHRVGDVVDVLVAEPALAPASAASGR